MNKTKLPPPKNLTNNNNNNNNNNNKTTTNQYTHLNNQNRLLNISETSCNSLLIKLLTNRRCKIWSHARTSNYLSGKANIYVS